MIDGADIYGAVKTRAIRVAELPNDALRALIGHLGRKQRLGAAAQRIGREAMAEAVIRFMGEAETQETRDKKPDASADTEALTDFVELTTNPDAPDA